MTLSIISQPLPLTCLSLNYYAKVMGINPAHFWGASGASLNPTVMPVAQCGSIYHQYAWQDADKVSRFDIAQEIAKAEADIANALHYWPAPVWIEEEAHEYPRFHRRDLFGIGVDNRLQYKGISTEFGKIIQMGKRLATFIATRTTAAGGGLTYLDDDSDGLYETARVVFATTITDPRQLHIYFAGMSGDPEYEIREPRRIIISGGTATFYFDSWLFIDPSLYELPTYEGGNEQLVDISTVANFVTSVDIYQITANNADESVKFYWGNEDTGCAICGGEGCEACGAITQDGCAYIKNSEDGIITPVPASYSATDALWDNEEWEAGREPDRLKLWYQCGMQSRGYISGRIPNPIEYNLARTIAFLATARMERPLCGCSNLQSLSMRLRQDAVNKEGESGMFFSTTDLVNNPFGTRFGEVAAWRDLTKLQKQRMGAAVIS